MSDSPGILNEGGVPASAVGLQLNTASESARYPGGPARSSLSLESRVAPWHPWTSPDSCRVGKYPARQKMGYGAHSPRSICNGSRVFFKWSDVADSPCAKSKGPRPPRLGQGPTTGDCLSVLRQFLHRRATDPPPAAGSHLPESADRRQTRPSRPRDAPGASR